MEQTASQFRTAAMFSGQTSLGRILVVDDEPDVRKVVRLSLEKAGYDVIEAEDGQQAVQEIKSEENPLLLDVILTDIRMPKLNGLEAIQFFQNAFPHVSLIVLTGFPDLIMATSLMKNGIIDYLVKPVEKEKLLTAVAKAMDQREINHL
ncbi:response regulator [Candidatus Nitrospira neomarina]|uniref:Response regulator n=1 Tax=Candidatus Nitrospira neomarina TaxID=3020899 RepID=A0AA96GFD8_9BACT|nr:response regulator [Candidatus Nitrospira neomarina]WNM61299.1 response regulator [Candidatus Nitrospira neomarina]